MMTATTPMTATSRPVEGLGKRLNMDASCGWLAPTA
jgi:hypothetical protein